jgi:hypothetical protein
MAVKYWAEIVRETPAAKNVCNEKVFYAVRVFKGSTTDPTEEYQLESFKIIELSGSDSRRAEVTTKNVKDLTEGAVIRTDDPFRKPSDIDYFRVSFTASKPGTYTPQFTIKVYEPVTFPEIATEKKLRASSEATDINNGVFKINIIVPRQDTTFNWGQVGYKPTKWQTVTIPSIVFTKAPTPPDRPGALAEATTVGGWTWDECTGKRWVAVFATYRYVLTKSPYTEQTTAASASSADVSGIYSKQIKYTVRALSAADIKAHPNDTFAQHKDAGRVKVIWTAAGWDWASRGIYFTEYKFANPSPAPKSYKNEAIVKRINFSKTICSGAGTGTGTGNPNTTKIDKFAREADGFNPLPHNNTRSFPGWIYDGGFKPVNQEAQHNELGMFYVDPDLYNLGKIDPKDKIFDYNKAGNTDRPWGFRFLFNPTYLTYNVSATSTVDWTRPNVNGATLVAPGIGGDINLNLMVDRVADMTSLRTGWLNDRANWDSAKHYPKALTDEQCAGLLYRGTEYDLEYLFRVMNGDPQSSTLLGPKADSLEMFTSNLGYVAQIPFIFKINKHLRFKVILSNVSFEHSMFTRDMVPTRTVVQISLQRLPDFSSAGSRALTADTWSEAIKTLPAAATGRVVDR